MSTAANSLNDAPVKRTVTVKASPERAFEVFTTGFDSWWPRSHHIGNAPMKRAIIEGRVGGRCYTEQTDGTDCDWGRVTLWEPPKRFVMAWMTTAEWKFEPDISKASEVEVRFTPEGAGMTRVDLEHRHFERMAPGWEGMRTSVNAEGGWAGLLKLFAAEAEKTN